MNPLARIAGAAACATVCSFGAASAQLRVATIAPPTFDSSFGQQLDAERDVDGDGTADWIVWASFVYPSGKPGFCVRVYSGRDAHELFTLFEGTLSDEFGRALTSLADIDGDGCAEIVVGDKRAAYGGPNAGRVWVFSGRTQAPLWTVDGVNKWDDFGHAVDDVLDADGDGIDDVIVGTSVGGAVGWARVYSGRTGTQLYHLTGVGINDAFGSRVAGVGDVNGDGRGDFGIGAWHANGAGFQQCGRVRVYDGRTGTLLREWIGAGDLDVMGTIRAAGDVDGNGYDDLLVTSAGVDAPGGKNCGAVRVFSGHDGSLLHLVYGAKPNLGFGYATRSLGDVDGDGVPDFAVSAPKEPNPDGTYGVVRVYTGRNASEIAILRGRGTSVSQGFAYALSPATDLNADGSADLALGANEHWPLAPSEIQVFTSLLVEPPTVYCTAKPNSQGCTPTLRYEGSPTLVYNLRPLRVIAEQVLAHQTGFLYWGLAPDASPFLGGTACVAQPWVRTRFGLAQSSGGSGSCDGWLAFGFAPAHLAQHGLGAGVTLHAQFAYRDPTHPDGTGAGLTAAMRFTLSP